MHAEVTRLLKLGYAVRESVWSSGRLQNACCDATRHQFLDKINIKGQITEGVLQFIYLFTKYVCRELISIINFIKKFQVLMTCRKKQEQPLFSHFFL